jgi:hypothetical protein
LYKTTQIFTWYKTVRYKSKNLTGLIFTWYKTVRYKSKNLTGLCQRPIYHSTPHDRSIVVATVSIATVLLLQLPNCNCPLRHCECLAIYPWHTWGNRSCCNVNGGAMGQWGNGDQSIAMALRDWGRSNRGNSDSNDCNGDRSYSAMASAAQLRVAMQRRRRRNGDPGRSNRSNFNGTGELETVNKEFLDAKIHDDNKTERETQKSMMTIKRKERQ